MRFLLALLLIVPAFAQEQPAAPAAQTQSGTAAAQAAPQAPAAAPAAPAKTEAAAADNPAPATEPWVKGSIDFGYLWTDGHGNRDMYRTLVDQRDGPRVLGVDITLQDPKKHLFDELNARAYGWGGDPYNTAHVDARKLGKYEFNFDYRNIAYFDNVPSFANPFAPNGVDEQSYDTHRRMWSLSLTAHQATHFVPYLAFDHNSGYGHGLTTFVNESSDEFAVPYLLRDATNNYRGGVRIEYSHFHITLEQGGTTYKDDDSAYDTQSTQGDNHTPILGQQIGLNSLSQNYGIRGHSIYSKVMATANPVAWLDLYGQFLFSEPKTDVNFSQIANGNLLLLSSVLFYNGQLTLGTGAANQPHTTANVGFEFRRIPRLRLIESFMTDRYHDAASPVVAEQIFLTVNPTTAGPNLLTSLNYSQYVNYNQQQLDVFYDLTNKLTLHGGWRYVWGDAQVLAGQLSQTGTLATGQLQRNVGLAGLTFRPLEKLSLHLDYEGSSSDDVYFRTSLNNYSKGRAQARYQINSALSLQANFQVLNNQNPAPDIRYDFQSRDNSISFYWTPKEGKRITVMGEYDRSSLRSNIAYLDLPFLTSAVSNYRDNAHTATSAVDVMIPGTKTGKLTFGGSMFISSGSRPSRYYQPLARLSLPIQKHVYWNTEWQWYGYGESFYLYEGFRTHIFTTGLRLLR
jgi:hypothetical protein